VAAAGLAEDDLGANASSGLRRPALGYLMRLSGGAGAPLVVALAPVGLTLTRARRFAQRKMVWQYTHSWTSPAHNAYPSDLV